MVFLFSIALNPSIWQCLPVIEVYWTFDGEVNVLNQETKAELEMELKALEAELRGLQFEFELGNEALQTEINGLERDIELIKDIIDQ